MNILTFSFSFIFICSIAVLPNVHGMAAPLTPSSRLDQLSRSLMQNKSFANATQVRNQANIIKAEVAADEDVKLAKRACDLIRRAQGIINLQGGIDLDNTRQRRITEAHSQMRQEWTRLDQEMPDFSRINLHPAN